MSKQPAISSDLQVERHNRSDEHQTVAPTPSGDANTEEVDVRARKRATASRPETGDLKGSRRSSETASLATKSAAAPSRALSLSNQPAVHSPTAPSSSTPASPASHDKQPPPTAQSTQPAPSSASPELIPAGPEENDAELEDENEELEEVVPTRVGTDSGFAWVILFASFVCNFLVDGIGFSFGVFMADVQAEFEAPKYVVALAGSLCIGVYLLVGAVRAINFQIYSDLL